MGSVPSDNTAVLLLLCSCLFCNCLFVSARSLSASLLVSVIVRGTAVTLVQDRSSFEAEKYAHSASQHYFAAMLTKKEWI